MTTKSVDTPSGPVALVFLNEAVPTSHDQSVELLEQEWSEKVKCRPYARSRHKRYPRHLNAVNTSLRVRRSRTKCVRGKQGRNLPCSRLKVNLMNYPPLIVLGRLRGTSYLNKTSSAVSRFACQKITCRSIVYFRTEFEKAWKPKGSIDVAMTVLMIVHSYTFVSSFTAWYFVLPR